MPHSVTAWKYEGRLASPLVPQPLLLCERAAYGVLGGVSVLVPSAGGVAVDASDVVVEVSVLLDAEADAEASAAGVLDSADIEVLVSLVLAQAASSSVANANNAREAWRRCVFMAFSLASDACSRTRMMDPGQHCADRDPGGLRSTQWHQPPEPDLALPLAAR